MFVLLFTKAFSGCIPLETCFQVISQMFGKNQIWNVMGYIVLSEADS